MAKQKKETPATWSKPIQLNNWNAKKPKIIAGIDLDGDIGIEDHTGYSIIINKNDINKLRDWLNERISENNQKNVAREQKSEMPAHAID